MKVGRTQNEVHFAGAWQITIGQTGRILIHCYEEK